MDMTAILEAIRELPLPDRKKLIAEVQRSILEEEVHAEDRANWQESFPKGSIISPDDEKNIQRIWKSPGGC